MLEDVTLRFTVFFDIEFRSNWEVVKIAVYG